MAFEKKSLISSRTATQKAIVATNASPLSAKIAGESKVASMKASMKASMRASMKASMKESMRASKKPV